MLYLVEHFYSIQGEGRHVGTPSLFFRFGGCNLRCEGFGCTKLAPNGEHIVGCDTLYAVHRSAFGEEWFAIEELQTLIWIINSYTLPPHVDVVLTGGEPLIYANNPLFIAFIEYLIDNGHRVSFETNGTLAPDFERYPFFCKATYALSVKLSNSAEAQDKRVRYDVLDQFIHHAPESFFKFSLADGTLAEEIEPFAQRYPHAPIYCMPLGGSRHEIEAHAPSVIELCKEKGWNYTDRLHIRIWDQDHGV